MEELTRRLLAARDGDLGALGAFVRSSQADEWRFVAPQAGEADADDVIQDVYVRPGRAAPAFPTQRRGTGCWRSPGGPASTRGAGDSRRVTDRVGRCALVDRLPPDRRAPLVLTQLLGCWYDEAAVVCGVPVGTIRSRVAGARTELLGRVRDAEAG